MKDQSMRMINKVIKHAALLVFVSAPLLAHAQLPVGIYSDTQLFPNLKCTISFLNDPENVCFLGLSAPSSQPSLPRLDMGLMNYQWLLINRAHERGTASSTLTGALAFGHAGASDASSFAPDFYLYLPGGQLSTPQINRLGASTCTKQQPCKPGFATQVQFTLEPPSLNKKTSHDGEQPTLTLNTADGSPFAQFTINNPTDDSFHLFLHSKGTLLNSLTLTESPSVGNDGAASRINASPLIVRSSADSHDIHRYGLYVPAKQSAVISQGKKVPPNTLDILIKPGISHVVLADLTVKEKSAQLNASRCGSQVNSIENAHCWVDALSPYALNAITATNYNWEINGNKVITTFTLMTQALDTGTPNVPVLLVLPQRSELHLITDNSLTTTQNYSGFLPFPEPLPSSDEAGIQGLEKTITQWYNENKAIQFGLKNGVQNQTLSFDTLASQMNSMSNMVLLLQGLADNAYVKNVQHKGAFYHHLAQEVSKAVESRFDDYLSAQSDPTRYFGYNKQVAGIFVYPKMLNKQNPSLYFPSKTYGDWVDAFANVIDAHLQRYLPAVEMIQNDYAGECPLDAASNEGCINDAPQPFLRAWDAYQGKYTNGAALNADAALIKLGVATHNDAMKNLGIYFYTTELQTVTRAEQQVSTHLTPAEKLVKFVAWAGSRHPVVDADQQIRLTPAVPAGQTIALMYNHLRAITDYGVRVFDVNTADTPFYAVYHQASTHTMTYLFDNVNTSRSIEFSNHISVAAHPGLNVCTTQEGSGTCLPERAANTYPTVPQAVQYNPKLHQVCWQPSTVAGGTITDYRVESFPVPGQLTASLHNGTVCTSPLDLPSLLTAAKQQGFPYLSLAIVAEGSNGLVSAPAVFRLPSREQENTIPAPSNLTVPTNKLTQGAVWVYWYPPTGTGPYTYDYGFVPGNVDCSQMARPYPLTTTQTNVFASGPFFNPNTLYTVCVYAEDTSQDQSSSAQAQFTTPTGISPPSVTTSNPTTTTVDVSWTIPPDTNPGVTSFSYKVEAYQEGIPVTSSLQPSLAGRQTTIQGLSEALPYTIQVIAYDNPYGYQSSAGSSAVFYTQGITPPTNITADLNGVIYIPGTGYYIPNTANVPVTWTASQNYYQNPSPLTYTVTATSSDSSLPTVSITTSATSAMLNGLVAGVTYTLEITATDGIHSESESNPVPFSTVNPKPLPPAYLNVCAEPAPINYVLNWPPAVDPTPNQQGGVMRYKLYIGGSSTLIVPCQSVNGVCVYDLDNVTTTPLNLGIEAADAFGSSNIVFPNQLTTNCVD